MASDDLKTPVTGDTVSADDIDARHVMQLATSSAAQPWVCTVYFVVHEANFYWLSFPERRHSKELMANPRIAIAVALRQNQPVVGIQVEGKAEEVSDVREIKAVMDHYVAKYGQGGKFIELFLAERNKHVLYRARPHQIVLFDERDHPALPRREVTIT